MLLHIAYKWALFHNFILFLVVLFPKLYIYIYMCVCAFYCVPKTNLECAVCFFFLTFLNGLPLMIFLMVCLLWFVLFLEIVWAFCLFLNFLLFWCFPIFRLLLIFLWNSCIYNDVFAQILKGYMNHCGLWAGWTATNCQLHSSLAPRFGVSASSRWISSPNWGSSPIDITCLVLKKKKTSSLSENSC